MSMHKSCKHCSRQVAKGSDICVYHTSVQLNRLCRVCNERHVLNLSNMLCEACYNRLCKYYPLRIKCFDILGWSCKCCGNNDFYHLVIDHLDASTKESNKVETYLIKVIEHKSPHEEFQVLCWSCNRSKNKGNRCTINHNIKTREDIIKYLNSLDLKYDGLC